MLSKGFEDVYHLKGGILKYLETKRDESSSPLLTLQPSEVPELEKDSLWQGECYVFDQRVSVKSDLSVGSYKSCFACRHPLTAGELESNKYEEGISCQYCFDSLTDKKRKSDSERQLQINLSSNYSHLGQKWIPPSKTKKNSDEHAKKSI